MIGHLFVGFVALVIASTCNAERAQLREGASFCMEIAGAECDHGSVYSGRYKGATFEQTFPDATSFVVGTSSTNSVVQWNMGCFRDKMTSEKSCSGSHRDLWISLSQSGAMIVSVGVDNFPGSTTSIRINSKRFDTQHRDGNFGQARSIIPLLKDGSTLVTRYMKWPHREWIDEEVELAGVETFLALLRWSLKNVK